MMKRYILMLCVIFTLLIPTSVSAANIVYSNDFSEFGTGQNPIEEEYAVFSGKVNEDETGKYFTGTIAMKKLPQKRMVINLDIRLKKGSEQYQIALTRDGSTGNWIDMYAHFYDCIVDPDGIWHNASIVFDIENRKVYSYVDGKLTATKNGKTEKGGFDTPNAGLAINFIELEVKNFEAAYDDGDDMLGIDGIKFNGMSYTASGESYGTLPVGLEYVAVMSRCSFENPNAFTVTKNDEEVSYTSVYNEETHYFDIVPEGGYESGATYRVTVSEEQKSALGDRIKCDSFTFSIADTSYEFKNLTVTNDTGAMGEVTFLNNTFTSQNAVMLLFVYDSDGKLKACASGEEKNVASAAEETLTAEIEGDFSGCTVKAYVWDSVYNAIPIMSAE